MIVVNSKYILEVTLKKFSFLWRHYVAEAYLELIVLLPPFPKFKDFLMDGMNKRGKEKVFLCPF